MGKLFPSIGTGENLDKPINQPLFHTIEYELSGIVEKIKNIDNFNEKEIKEIIVRQHGKILNYDNFLSSKGSREYALSLFTNKKFLRCFLDVIRILEISDHEKICINKLAYDYYILPNKDIEVSDLLFQLTTEVNGKEVVILSGILGRTDAQILLMIRNSSFNEEKVVHRINSFLVKYNVIDLSLQQMVSIYCCLFQRVTTLFVQTMLEPRPANLLDYQSKNFDKISIAILEIVNSMPSSEIKTVVKSYAYALSNVNKNIEVRFAIRSMIKYDRIIKIVKEVEFEGSGLFSIKIP